MRCERADYFNDNNRVIKLSLSRRIYNAFRVSARNFSFSGIFIHSIYFVWRFFSRWPHWPKACAPSAIRYFVFFFGFSIHTFQSKKRKNEKAKKLRLTSCLDIEFIFRFTVQQPIPTLWWRIYIYDSIILDAYGVISWFINIWNCFDSPCGPLAAIGHTESISISVLLLLFIQNQFLPYSVRSNASNQQPNRAHKSSLQQQFGWNEAGYTLVVCVCMVGEM